MATLSEGLDDLRRRLYHDDRSEDDVLLLKIVQILKRIADAGGEFSIVNIVSQATGEGKLDVTWGDVPKQLDPVKAREIAWMLLEGASIAETEAAVVRFMTERVGLDANKAAMMLQDFRRYREQRPASLVGEKGH
jgi:hypothetical protein